MPKVIDFYWDVGSTNTYFAVFQLGPILKRTGASVRYHPLNLGYMFRANNYVLSEEPLEKLRYRKRDLERWAELAGLPFKIPDKFPIKTSRALRGAIAMRHWKLEVEYIQAIFKAYWEEGIIVEEYPVLREIAETLGVDGRDFEQRSESEEVRQVMIRTHDEALQKGVFGAPTFLVGNEMFWGKDRLDFLERELGSSCP
jgi:2-hydroxychromene-2-carboxylate isomerase